MFKHHSSILISFQFISLRQNMSNLNTHHQSKPNNKHLIKTWRELRDVQMRSLDEIEDTHITLFSNRYRNGQLGFLVDLLDLSPYLLCTLTLLLASASAHVGWPWRRWGSAAVAAEFSSSHVSLSSRYLWFLCDSNLCFHHFTSIMIICILFSLNSCT